MARTEGTPQVGTGRDSVLTELAAVLASAQR